jgi:deoxyribodipyrimidine photo-lyase
MTVRPTLVWFRQDLRLHDHPALVAACGEGAIIPIYILDDVSPGARKMGGAQHWWLHHSLAKLSASFAEHGVELILRCGDSASELARLCAEAGTERIHTIRHFEPWWQNVEAVVSSDFDLVRHDGNQLAPPSSILTGGGTRFRVFTPWWKALLTKMPPPKPLPVPAAMQGFSGLHSDSLESWSLLPRSPDWSGGFSDWTPGEEGARDALRSFLPSIGAYDHDRNFPAKQGISRLSPHLHFGEISPATIWHHASKAAGAIAEPFLREVGWRDYATNLIDQFPDYPDRNGKPAYDKMEWRRGPEADRDFLAWTRGQTGYPIVDAGMRELWATGFMHNRVRMIAASFLIKHLLIDWRRGEQWFWDTLLDADYGANGSNWQWVAGTGVDAPLFSRIMAPLSQSEKFGAGDYIRKWVPELAGLPDPHVHDPDEFGLRPRAYPVKIIGHKEARERALAAMQACRARMNDGEGPCDD